MGGGGKRARDQPEEFAIPNSENIHMVAMETDAQVIKNILSNDVNIHELLVSMSTGHLEDVLESIEKYKSHPFRDTSVRAYSIQLPDMVSLEDCSLEFLNSFHSSLIPHIWKVSFPNAGK